jgi:hypothetical protein
MRVSVWTWPPGNPLGLGRAAACPRLADSAPGYEAQRIAAGARIDDPHFYDAFDAEHEAIASPIGPADRFLVGPGRSIRPPDPVRIAVMVFCAGLFAFATALLFRFVARRAGARRSVQPPENTETV